MPIDFNENLDQQFENKKLEINNRIIQLRYEKEKASQQNQKNPGTNAYNPIPPMDVPSEEEPPKSRSNHSSDADVQSDSEISSDSDDQSAANVNLKNELNHA